MDLYKGNIIFLSHLKKKRKLNLSFGPSMHSLANYISCLQAATEPLWELMSLIMYTHFCCLYEPSNDILFKWLINLLLRPLVLWTGQGHICKSWLELKLCQADIIAAFITLQLSNSAGHNAVHFIAILSRLAENLPCNQRKCTSWLGLDYYVYVNTFVISIDK